MYYKIYSKSIMLATSLNETQKDNLKTESSQTESTITMCSECAFVDV